MLLPTNGAYLERIRTARKTTTIRLARPRASVGSVILFTNYRETIRTRCVSVDSTLVRLLTEQHALDDGFDSLDDLHAALRTHYPALRADTAVFVIRFELLAT